MPEGNTESPLETPGALKGTVEESRLIRLLRGLGLMGKTKVSPAGVELEVPQKIVTEDGRVLILVPTPSPEAAAAPPVTGTSSPSAPIVPAAAVADKLALPKTAASVGMPSEPLNSGNPDSQFLSSARPASVQTLDVSAPLDSPPMPTRVSPKSPATPAVSSGSSLVPGEEPYPGQSSAAEGSTQPPNSRRPVLSETGFVIKENSMNAFDKFLTSKFANANDPYYPGIGSPANLLIAGLGGYGGSQLGSSLAGVGTRGSARRQLANVESQLMQIVTDPALSSRQKKRLLTELNRESKLLGAGSASMPGTPGQAEAMSRNMSERLAGKLQNRRLPGMRGLGIVAGAAAPFILPDFLRRAGVI